MKLALLCIGAAVVTIVTPAPAQEPEATAPAAPARAPRHEGNSTQAQASSVDWGPPPAPQYQRNSTPLTVTGIALTGFGALSVIGGGITAGVGMMTNSCRWGGNDCQSETDLRLSLIGFGILVIGGGLGLGLGIPLWHRGARRVPVALDGTAPTATTPVILIGPRAAGLRWIF